MTRRRRNPTRPRTESQIDWLQHRTGYPSIEEREQIIRLRQELTAQMILFGISNVSTDDRRYRALINKYGVEEIQRIEQKLREGIDIPSRVADDAKSYREYRLRYSHFGAGLKFCTAKEMGDLYDAYFKQLQAGREQGDDLASGKVNELEKLLLTGWRDWDDLVPPAIPTRPADYSTPAPASYTTPIDRLLEWGDDLHKSQQFADETEYRQWKKFVPALTRMALDHGLLNGWPSESASWAPWHAIHTLGNLQAWESGPALAELADFENDWLSDHLPHIWADMGVNVEPLLWMILETPSASTKRRGLAAESLLRMTEKSNAISNKVIHGFEKILRHTVNVDSTLNAYLVMFLKDMEIPDKTLETIHEAFEADRIDLSVITPQDLEDDDE